MGVPPWLESNQPDGVPLRNVNRQTPVKTVPSPFLRNPSGKNYHSEIEFPADFNFLKSPLTHFSDISVWVVLCHFSVCLSVHRGYPQFCLWYCPGIGGGDQGLLPPDRTGGSPLWTGLGSTLFSHEQAMPQAVCLLRSHRRTFLLHLNTNLSVKGLFTLSIFKKYNTVLTHSMLWVIFWQNNELKVLRAQTRVTCVNAEILLRNYFM